MFGWDTVIYIIISLILSYVAYLMAPKPKMPKPAAATQMDSPTSEAGIPVPVLFGTMTMKAPNFLWYGDKNIREFKVKA